MKKLISLVSLFCLSVFLPLSVMGEPIDREAVSSGIACVRPGRF